MINVAHISDRLSARGGADRHLLGVLEHLAGRARATLLVGRDDGSLPERERRGLPPWRRIKGLDRSGLSGRGGRAAAGRLAAALKDLAPDLIHLHNLMDPGLIALAAQSAPALMTVQDHRLFCPGAGKLLPGGAICRRPLGDSCAACFRDADYGRRMLVLTRDRLYAAAGLKALIVLSRYMAGELTAAFGALRLPAPPIQVIPPFVHGLELPAREGPGRYHLLACRLVERKGVRVALAAAGLGAGAPLVIAGDGTLAAEAAEAAAASGGRVRYAGWAQRAGMSRLLAGALSLWLPSLWAEPFGIAGLEALAAGVPVLASRVGGVDEWLAPGAGELLPPGEAGALARAARRLAGDPELARRRGAAGRRAAAGFAPGPLMERLLALYWEWGGQKTHGPAGGRRNILGPENPIAGQACTAERKQGRESMTEERREMGVEEMRARIVKAAAALYEKKGRETTVDEIASAAGMSVPVTYQFVKKPADIMMLIMENIAAEFEAQVEPILDSGEGGEMKLRQAVELYYRVVDAERSRFMMLYRGSRRLDKDGRKRIMKAELDTVRVFQRLVEEGMDQGVFKADDAEQAAYNIVYLGHMWALKSWHFNKRGLDLDTFIETQMDMIMAMLGAGR